MIQISGLLYKIASTDNTDRETGVISQVHSAEILHEVRGKTEISSVKLDASVVEAWSKCIGKTITNEIRFYAIKTREGGILQGITLADKKTLPGIHPQK